MRDDRFEWDDAKAASNARKHGVTFEAAREAFDDPDGIDELDDDPDEEYWALTALTRSGLLYVVHAPWFAHTHHFRPRGRTT